MLHSELQYPAEQAVLCTDHLVSNSKSIWFSRLVRPVDLKAKKERFSE